MSALPDSTLADPKDRLIAELQRQLAASNGERDEVLAERDKAQWRLGERTAERDEALEQQIAAAEVLQVINSSPGNVVPVFGAFLEKAMRLCDAAFGLMRISDGSQLRIAHTRGVPAAYAEFLSRNPLPAGQGGIATRIADGDTFVH